MFENLTPHEAGCLDGALFGGLEGAPNAIWDETAEVLKDLREQQPQMTPGSVGFRLPGRR